MDAHLGRTGENNAFITFEESWKKLKYFQKLVQSLDPYREYKIYSFYIIYTTLR